MCGKPPEYATLSRLVSDRGETCRYLHEVGDVPTNYSGPRERGKCYAFQRGSCFRGETCRFSHDFTLESEQPKPDGVAR